MAYLGGKDLRHAVVLHFTCLFQTLLKSLVLGLHVFTEDSARTRQCTREVEDTLVELADGTPVIKEHLYHLPSTHRLRKRVLVGQINMPRGGWKRQYTGLFRHKAGEKMQTFPYYHRGNV